MDTWPDGKRGLGPAGLSSGRQTEALWPPPSGPTWGVKVPRGTRGLPRWLRRDSPGPAAAAQRLAARRPECTDVRARSVAGGARPSRRRWQAV